MSDTPDTAEAAAAEYSTFRIGSVLGQSISVFLRNIVPFTLMALIVTSPTYIYWFYKVPQIGSPGFFDDASFITGLPFGPIIAVVVGWILSIMVTAGVIFGTVQELRGRRASIVLSLTRGLPRVLPVIAVSIVVSIAIGFSVLLLIIPGVIVLVMTWVAVPAAVMEKPGIFGSLSRSAELTSGYRWRVLVLVILSYVISAVVAGIFSLVVGLVSGESVNGALAADFVGKAFGAALVGVITAVTYYQLRVVQDGVDIDQIAAVFD